MTERSARRSYSRRGVLRTAAGAAAGAAVGAAATGTAAAQTDFDGWFTGDGRGGATDNYDGTVADRTGQDEVTVEVGADGNGGTFAFAPPAIRVSPGTTVTFEWASDTHNVVVESQPDGASWSGHESIENSGFSFSSTFEAEGVYKYFCSPHLTTGMKGAIVVGGGGGGGGGGSGGDPVPAEYGDWFTGNADGGATDNFSGETVDRTGQDEVTVEVGANGNGGSFAFAPAAVRVSPGTTVTFEWTSDTHNVLVQSQPDGAGWQGHEAIENSGFTFSHTFETRGVYTYYCDPHLSVGMKGAVVVGPAPQEAGGGGPAGTTTPFSPMLGWALAGGFVAATLLPVLAGVYRRGQPTTPTYDGDEVPEAPAHEPTEEIGHDGYDPVGTASLIVVYFLIIAGMWAFMYFVEFLGNGPTVGV